MRGSVESLMEDLYRRRYANFREALAPIVGDRDRAHDVVQEAFPQALRNRGGHVAHRLAVDHSGDVGLYYEPDVWLRHSLRG